MVEATPLKKASVWPRVLVYGAVLSVTGYMLWDAVLKHKFTDTGNYEVVYDAPSGWKKLPPKPLVNFIYQEPKTKMLIRGSINNVVAEHVALPELNTNGLAKHFIEITETNLPGWKARVVKDLTSESGERFRIVRRSRNDRCIVTAMTVRGNATVMVTLSAFGSQQANIDELMPKFEQFLTTVRLKPKVYL